MDIVLKLNEVGATNLDFVVGTLPKDFLGGWEVIKDSKNFKFEHVKYFPKINKYFKVTGFYNSYHGYEFLENPIEVQPKTKTIEIYE